MSEKEKSCTLKYKSCLKFFANPQLAVAATLADNVPNNKEVNAINISIIAYLTITFISLPVISSINCAITIGIIHSIITSKAMNTADNIDGFLYSLILFINTLIT